MSTLANAAHVDGLHLRWADALDNSLRAIQLARRISDPQAEVRARFWASMTTIGLGSNIEGARVHAADGLATAERLRDPSRLARALWAGGTISMLEGDWKVSHAYYVRAMAVSPPDPWVLGSQALQSYQVGEFLEGDATLNRLAQVIEHALPGQDPAGAIPALVIPLAARIGGGSHEHEVSFAGDETVVVATPASSTSHRLDVAQTAADAVLSTRTVPMFATLARIGLALMAVQGDDAEAAREQYGHLLRGRGILAFVISIDRVLGLLAHTMGQPEDAISHFEEALVFCRKAGCRVELAWACCEYAEVLGTRAHAGDQDRAMSLLDESLTIARDLGMGPLEERCLSRLSR